MRLLRPEAYTIVEYGAETDVCVINTCSVTEGAEAKCRQSRACRPASLAAAPMSW